MNGFSRISGVLARFRQQRATEKPSKNRPPNTHVEVSIAERGNRTLLLSLAQTHGPMFRVQYAGQETVCVVGLPLGRQLLKEHAAAFRPYTLDLKALFPLGFLRQLEGMEHQKYRKSLIGAINSLDHDDYKEDLEKIASTAFSNFYENQKFDTDSGSQFRETLSSVSTNFLFRTFFGVTKGHDAFRRLTAYYQRLGPHGLVWNIQHPQFEAFAGIREAILELANSCDMDLSKTSSHSILQNIVHQGGLNETMIGNLIYMVEMGRYDMRGLFRWITKYAAYEPDWVDSLAKTAQKNPSESRTLAKAFIQETLRMDQSEFLLRDVKKDITFENFRILKGEQVRVCMWESHKDATRFENPLAFQHDRFLATTATQDEFSPFGIDHHQCPFSAMSIMMGIVFLTSLARNYKVSPINDGETLKGPYHWEPASLFSVSLKKRNMVFPQY